MSRLAKALAEYQEHIGKRRALLDAEYQSWEEKVRGARQTLETQNQTVLEEQNKLSAVSARIPKLQQELAHAEAEAEEIDQAAQLAKAETKILETAEQKIYTKLRDGVAYLRQLETEAEKLFADVKVAMLSAGTNDLNGNMAMGPSTWMSLRMPQQAHPMECSTAGELVPSLSNQDSQAAAQAANSLGSPADMAAMLEDADPRAHSLPSVSHSEAEALGARGTLAQPLRPESVSQLGYAESPRLAYSGDGGSNQTMQIPMLAGESSPAAPGSARSAPVHQFSTLVPHPQPPRARPQAQQLGQAASFTQPGSRLGRAGHAAARGQPPASQQATYSFFPSDSMFNPGARGMAVASSQAALPNGEGATSMPPMSMGTAFGNEHMLSPRHQSPSMQQQQQQQQHHHHHLQMNGHMQQQSPHAPPQLRSPATSQPQSFILNGHLQQPAVHSQQQQKQLGSQQGALPHGGGPRSPMQQSQQQSVAGTQRPQPLQQPQQGPQPMQQQQQPQQRPQPMQLQQQAAVQNGGPAAAGVGTPQPQQQQQQQPQLPSRAATSDQPAGPSPAAQPSGLKVVIPMVGRNRSEGQAPTDSRTQPGSATSEPSSTTQTQSGSAKLGASGPQPKIGGQRGKRKRKTDAQASKA